MAGELPGATLGTDGQCQWRVWAPSARVVDLVLFDSLGRATATHRMYPLKFGYFGQELGGIQVGQRYAYRLDDGPPRPDPASRWQPAGVHHASAIWRPEDFAWTDSNWAGRNLDELVIYELHIGTFTPEGTFAAVIPRLPDLRELGVTAIELMPVGQFPGNRGWGYDGVYWYAAQQSYGGPTELQRLVDACHAHGIAVILDVVYNHLGPEGNYLAEFGHYFTDRYQTPWGAALNWDGSGCRAVRDLAIENARSWIRDFHLDGLRLDAAHEIHDQSRWHILGEIRHAVANEERARRLPIHVMAESNLRDPMFLDSPAVGGCELDALWNDDFHHAVHALLTGERDGYYAEFADPAKQLVEALNHVFVRDRLPHHQRNRPSARAARDYPSWRFVVSVQTHDQVGNRPTGDRFGTILDERRRRLAAGLLLLSPYVPLLFMGEEYGEQRPFPFFCEFGDESLREAVRSGRQREFSDFNWGADWPEPCEYRTFESAKLTWRWPDGSEGAELRRLYRILLDLRARHPALRGGGSHVARLIPDDQSPELLCLQRQAAPPEMRQMEIIFNLTERPVPIPTSSRDETAPRRCLVAVSGSAVVSDADQEPATSILEPFGFMVRESLIANQTHTRRETTRA